MNIGTHFHYNSYIVFVSTHTKIGTPHKKALVTVQMEVNLLIELFSNVQFSPVSISNYKQAGTNTGCKPKLGKAS